jgi:hypothetical protein
MKSMNEAMKDFSLDWEKKKSRAKTQPVNYKTRIITHNKPNKNTHVVHCIWHHA